MHQHAAERRMVELAERFPAADGLTRRALNQAARELLLAQSSDWAFIITTGTMVQYAIKRFKDHIHRFTRLYDMLLANEVDEAWLGEVEARDTIFQEIDYRVYCWRVTVRSLPGSMVSGQAINDRRFINGLTDKLVSILSFFLQLSVQWLYSETG
jgi:hypothetical protein